jgi:hypothetical protein
MCQFGDYTIVVGGITIDNADDYPQGTIISLNSDLSKAYAKDWSNGQEGKILNVICDVAESYIYIAINNAVWFKGTSEQNDMIMGAGHEA